MNHRADEHKGHHHSHGDSRPPYWKRAHRDWKTWVAVTLMLVGILIYILTLDQSVRPAGPPQAPVPIAN